MAIATGLDQRTVGRVLKQLLDEPADRALVDLVRPAHGSERTPTSCASRPSSCPRARRSPGAQAGSTRSGRSSASSASQQRSSTPHSRPLAAHGLAERRPAGENGPGGWSSGTLHWRSWPSLEHRRRHPRPDRPIPRRTPRLAALARRARPPRPHVRQCHQGTPSPTTAAGRTAWPPRTTTPGPCLCRRPPLGRRRSRRARLPRTRARRTPNLGLGAPRPPLEHRHDPARARLQMTVDSCIDQLHSEVLPLTVQ